MQKTQYVNKLETFLNKLTHYPLLLLTAIYSLHIIFTLNTRALWFSDEVRYANVYENLIKAKKWLVLYLNGQPYPDKPPLYFWFLALISYLTSLSGETLFFLGSAISGFFYLILTYFLGKVTLQDTQKSFLGACLLLTNFYFLGLIHYFRMDLLFASFILFAHLTIYHFIKSQKTAYLYAGFGLSFLALLTKGPLGILFPLLTLFCFSLVQKQPKLFFNKHVGFGILGILLGGLLWLLGAYYLEGKEFISNILYDQIYRRATHTWHHPHPFYHYLLVFPLVVLPWTLSFINFSKKEWQNLSHGELFLLVFFSSGFTLLSLISIKIAIYLLPLFAPFFLLLHKNLQTESQLLSKVMGYFFLILAISLPWINFLPNLPLKINGLLGLAGILAILSIILIKKPVPSKTLPIFLLLTMPLIFIYTGKYIAPSLDKLMSPKEQALQIKKYIKMGYHPLAYKIYSGIYTYYAKHNIEETKDLTYVEKMLKEKKKILLIMPEKYFKKWKSKPKKINIVHKQKIVEKVYYLITNQPQER